MVDRTLRFFGKGFGNSPVVITAMATLGGSPVEVYSGEISTDSSDLPNSWYDPDLYTLMFDVQVPVEFSGVIPISIVIESGFGILMATADANYIPVPNSVYTPEQFEIIINPNSSQEERLNVYTTLASPPFTSEEIAILINPDTSSLEIDALLESHGLATFVSGGPNFYSTVFWPSDARANVIINGNPVLPPSPRPSDMLGDWTWAANSTITFDLSVSAGLE
jgi:hypothetical protein